MHLFMYIFSQDGFVFNANNAPGPQIVGKHDEVCRASGHGGRKQNALDSELVRPPSDGLAACFPAFVLELLPVLSFRLRKKRRDSGEFSRVGEIKHALKSDRERNEDAGKWTACLQSGLAKTAHRFRHCRFGQQAAIHRRESSGRVPPSAELLAAATRQYFAGAGMTHRRETKAVACPRPRLILRAVKRSEDFSELFVWRNAWR